MVRVKRLHKNLSEAKKAIKKEDPHNLDGLKIFKIKGAKVWKFKVATELEWLHGLV